MDIRKNIANLTTFIRTYLIFVVICFLNSPSFILRVAGAVLLMLAAILDGVDGYFARRYRSYNKFGGIIDTLGDRITENILLIFFAYKQLIPLWIPLIVVARSFVSDFIRLICFRSGAGTFDINRSKWGFILVASKPSRFLYLAFKIYVFLLGSIVLCVSNPGGTANNININVLLHLKASLFYSSWVLVGLNLLRFALLIFDARDLLKKELLNR
ncbi:MAG: CDP-alcohol phosphatidyltransferase family protein [Candidatus Omnitrophota bacterium]|nr:CDP-alcohol phosphatidyltransferase family protein [Candidatus Omnitrophota bacterium]